jgi:hypothetical protein
MIVEAWQCSIGFRAPGIETSLSWCRAGWHPAADWQSASWSFRFIASRPINNHPQGFLHPYKKIRGL